MEWVANEHDPCDGHSTYTVTCTTAGDTSDLNIIIPPFLRIMTSLPMRSSRHYLVELIPVEATAGLLSCIGDAGSLNKQQQLEACLTSSLNLIWSEDQARRASYLNQLWLQTLGESG